MRKPMQRKKHEKLLSSPIILLAGVIVLLLVIFVITSFTGTPDKDNYYDTDELNPSAEVSSQGWTNYVNEEYGFQFKHPKNWTTELQRIEHGSVLLVSPPDATSNDQRVKVFIMDNGYFGIDGLPTTSVTVDGRDGVKVDDGLYGFMHNGKYVTLDSGYGTNIKPYFTEIVKSLRFK